jgi:hypothetical protein
LKEQERMGGEDYKRESQRVKRSSSSSGSSSGSEPGAHRWVCSTSTCKMKRSTCPADAWSRPLVL